MSNHYTEPSNLALLGYRLVYDPVRAGYLRGLVASLQLDGTERVLDFGSGPGSEATYLAGALDRGGRVTCLDVSPTWLGEARRRLRRFDNVDFLLGSASEVGLPAAAFDVVLAHYVLHDVDRASLADSIRALSSALRPGGRLVVVEPIGARHGFSADELSPLMGATGLIEQSREVVHPPFGSATRAVYRAI
jgi:SAM-dependent methyltransferase